MGNERFTAKKIGILALQGDYEKHRELLETRLGVTPKFVRTSEELAEVDALILPGGESTTIAKLMERIGLDAAIRDRVGAGMPVYGTCAGMILLAKSIEGRPDQPTLGLMDIVVARNAFGRQVDSFESDIPFRFGASKEAKDAKDAKDANEANEANDANEVTDVRGVFIRAPYVTAVGDDSEILSRFRDRVVGVRQSAMLATAFHPELTDDPRVHAYFLEMVEESSK